ILSGRRVLLADAVGAQVLHAATLAEAALPFGIGAIARTPRAGGGDDLIDDRGAVRVARHKPDDFGD
ncbi:MAG: hypothetical protein ACLPXW_22190, partial [Xanthobacteraceae bacterium]